MDLNKEHMMICKHCKDQIGHGEACRFEPVDTGSRVYNFYHCECYSIVKAARQRELPIPDNMNYQLDFQQNMNVQLNFEKGGGQY